MRNLKKHWRPMALVVTLLILAGSFWLSNGESKMVLAQAGGGEGYAPTDRAERQAVRGLLDELGLDRDALIALNLSGPQAESILATARTWRGDNAATRQTLRGAITAKVGEIRGIRRAIRMGPAQAGREEALNTALQELADARAAYKTACQPLEENVNALLSVSQRAAWTAIRKGCGQSMPLRMLDLTPDQRRTLSRAERHYKWRHAAAGTGPERQAAIAARHTAWEQTLTQGQQQMIDAYHGYLETASENVSEALGTVFPPA